AGNYGMAGPAHDPPLLFMWPNARISGVGGGQAATVLLLFRPGGVEAKGGKWGAGDEKTFKGPVRAPYDKQGNAFYATARLWDDGVIDPVDTRAVLGQALRAGLDAPKPEPTRFGIFRM